MLRITIIFFCLSSVISQNNDRDKVFEKRHYVFNYPDNYDPDKSYGLMIFLHGSSSNGTEMQTFLGKEYKNNSYFLLFPSAATENWDEGCKCNKPYRLGIDDVGFMSFLIDTFIKNYSIRTNSVFLISYSQGALFAQNLACKLSQKIRAIVSIAGNMSVTLHKECKPTKIMPVMIVHGTGDNVLPYNGSNNGSFSLISTEKTINFWLKTNHLNTKPTTIAKLNDTEKLVYGQNYPQVRLYKIADGGHYWPRHFNLRIEIMDFIKTNEVR